MSDNMSVDKKDPKEDSEDSMESSPEGEAPPAPPQQQTENQQPKRKGGRKPVRRGDFCGFVGRFSTPSCRRIVFFYVHLENSRTRPLLAHPYANTNARSTRHPRKGSNETAKPRRPFESAGPSTSSNSKRPSG